MAIVVWPNASTRCSIASRAGGRRDPVLDWRSVNRPAVQPASPEGHDQRGATGPVEGRASRRPPALEAIEHLVEALGQTTMAITRFTLHVIFPEPRSTATVTGVFGGKGDGRIAADAISGPLPATTGRATNEPMPT